MLGEIDLVGPTAGAEINYGDRDRAVAARCRNAGVGGTGALHRVSGSTRRPIVVERSIRSCHHRAFVFVSVACRCCIVYVTQYKRRRSRERKSREREKLLTDDGAVVSGGAGDGVRRGNHASGGESEDYDSLESHIS